MRIINSVSLILLSFSLSLSTAILACTDIRMTAKDGTVLITRTLEFGTDLKSNIRSSNKGRVFTTMTSDSKPAMSWKAKYGYIYLDGMGQDVALDGMNEAGLSFEALFLPGATKYQTIPAGKEQQSLPYLNLGDYILSNYSNVEEVKQMLPNLFVYAYKPTGLQTVYPLHFSIQDASGKGIIVEYVNGILNLYDNPLGVLTNSPTYNWQMTNLNNYIGLSPYTPSPIVTDGVVFAATGQGAGATGLPGDSSPPSRFVRMTFLTKTVLPADTGDNLLNLAQHIINTVDIPLGSVRAKVANGNDQYENTQWTVFKDLKRKILYFRTYGDLSLRSITLDKVDLSEKAKPLKMSINGTQNVQDVTNEFKYTS